ncbi:MAG: acyl carrier protein [Acidimicrobiales bacterium]
MTNLAEDLLTLIAQDVGHGDEPVAAATDLLLSGRVDSLGVVRIVHWLEERFQFSVDPADVTLEHFQTVNAIVAYVVQRQGDAA